MKGDDSFGVIVLTFADNSVSLSSNTTGLTLQICLSKGFHWNYDSTGGAAFRNLSIERLPAENVDAYWNYKVRHWTAYSAVTLCPAAITASYIHLEGEVPMHQQLSVSGCPECPPAVLLPYLSVWCCACSFPSAQQAWGSCSQGNYAGGLWKFHDRLRLLTY